MDPYLLQMKPLLVEKVWGGHRLAEHFAKADGDPTRLIGEAWEVADLAEGQSTIINGPLGGRPLCDAVARWGEDLVGRGTPTERFPLLVKLLDARDDLSVQVHPGAEHLPQFPGSHSKDESWMILNSDRGASILHGVRAGVSREELESSIDDGTAVDKLHRIEVQQGDVFRIAPGTVHAIGAGVCLLEIQEPSDTTFRVYDYQRPGLDGRPRPLHIEEALAVMRLESGDRIVPAQVTPGHEVLVDVEAYRIERLRGERQMTWRIREDSPQVLHVVAGRVSAEGVTLGRGDTVVAPACLGTLSLVMHTEDTVLVVAGLGGAMLVDA